MERQASRGTAKQRMLGEGGRGIFKPAWNGVCGFEEGFPVKPILSWVEERGPPLDFRDSWAALIYLGCSLTGMGCQRKPGLSDAQGPKKHDSDVRLSSNSKWDTSGNS